MAQTLIKSLVVGALDTNCYLVTIPEKRQAIIVDPGDDADYIISTLKDLNCQPVCIIATHGHFDHILAGRELQLAFGVPFLIHEKDTFLVARMQESARHFLQHEVVETPPQIDAVLDTQTPITYGGLSIDVYETPGHTPGSVCLYLQALDTLLSGDTMFANGAVGRTDFSYSSPVQLSESLNKIAFLPVRTRVYPGHGQVTTVGDENKIHCFAV